jgi:hypothetical protein
MIDPKHIADTLNELLDEAPPCQVPLHDPSRPVANWGLTLRDLQQQPGYADAAVKTLTRLSRAAAYNIYHNLYAAPYERIEHPVIYRLLTRTAAYLGSDITNYLLSEAVGLTTEENRPLCILTRESWTRIKVHEACPTLLLAEFVKARLRFTTEVMPAVEEWQLREWVTRALTKLSGDLTK